MRRMLPSVGFLMILLTLVLVAGFFAWASLTPNLEVVWDCQMEVMAGRAEPLGAAEEHALEAVVQNHPEWIKALANGRSTALFEAPETGCLRLDTNHLLVSREAAEATVLVRCSESEAAGGVKVKAGDGEWLVCEPGKDIPVVLPKVDEGAVLAVHRAPSERWEDGPKCLVHVLPLEGDGDGAQKDQ